MQDRSELTVATGGDLSDTYGMASFLIIEDDIKTAYAIRDGLCADGHTAIASLDGEEGLAKSKQQSFDAIVLDWMLPKISGIELLTTLRAAGNTTPVLLLTARDSVQDRVQGLDQGADDYLVKPFAFAELLARLRALIRRSNENESLRKQVADLTLDIDLRRAKRGDRSIVLTPREFDLLHYLFRHAGQTVTRPMLARDVWRDTQRVTPLDNVIDVHIAHLRRKVDDNETIKLIHTLRGIGFMLSDSMHD